MRRFNLLFGIFVLSLFVIPSFKANAATEVSNEEQLREAISQGGDIVIKDKIEVKDTLVINKDVNITGSISISADKTLIEVNGGTVNLDVGLIVGQVKEEYSEIKGGKALVINGGTVNLINKSEIVASDNAIIVNEKGTLNITDSLVGAANKWDNGAPIEGGKAIVANGGTITVKASLIAAGETAIDAKNNSKVKIESCYDEDNNDYEFFGDKGIYAVGTAITAANSTVNISNSTIKSLKGNAIEINDGSYVKYSSDITTRNGPGCGADYNVVKKIFATKNLFYINGGTLELSGGLATGPLDEMQELSSSIYINKGYNTKTNSDSLILDKDFMIAYENRFNINVNPEIKTLKIKDEKNWIDINNNNITAGMCKFTGAPNGGPCSNSEREEACKNIQVPDIVSNYEVISLNGISKCTNVDINGNITTIDDDGTCKVNNEANTPDVVEVPSTSAQLSIIIASIGIIFISVSILVIKYMTKKNN